MLIARGKPLLLVEDNKIDITNFQRALKKCEVENAIHISRTGEDAFKYLHGKRNIASGPKPGLIVLDLNMPVMNGLEFLEELKGDARLKSIPVVVLTTSAEEGDRSRAFELGIAGYFIKPMSFSDFIEMIKKIALYWELSAQP